MTEGSGTPVFITMVGEGIPTEVTPRAEHGLKQLGWTAPITGSPQVPRDSGDA